MKAANGSMARVADIVLRTLLDLGVDTFFGVPGGPISPIFDALHLDGKAHLVFSRQETNAAFSAGGFYRSSGRIPGVLVTAGPGATNALTGVTSAHLERIPMIVISGDVSWTKGGCLLQDSGPQGINVENLYRGLTRRITRIIAKSAASQVIDAFRAATNPENPGPVLIVLAIDQASSLVPVTHQVVGKTERKCTLQNEVLHEVLGSLERAKRPLIVLGAGCRSSEKVIVPILERLQIPVITTPRAKGLLSETHPCSLRHGGLAASRWAREYTQRGVDAALVLGTDLDDCSIGATPYICAEGELTHVDLDAKVFGRNLPTTRGIVADLESFVHALGLLLNRDKPYELNPEVADIKTLSAFDVPEFETAESMPLAPYRVLADLQRAWPDARFVTDIGEHMLFALHYLTAKDPQQFTIHLGLGSMGSGICSAVGMSLGDPQARVICVCGDGGMQMSGMEALVAKAHSSRVVFAVFNDFRYNMVHHGFKQVYGHEVRTGEHKVDFSAWGHSLGIPSKLICNPGDISRELLDHLTKNGPAILDVRIDPNLRLVGGGRNEALQQMSILEG